MTWSNYRGYLANLLQRYESIEKFTEDVWATKARLHKTRERRIERLAEDLRRRRRRIRRR
jgi:hypothetical protein